jgi:hypothetical protein
MEEVTNMQKTLRDGMKLGDHLQGKDIDNIKADLKLIVFEAVDWFHLALDGLLAEFHRQQSIYCLPGQVSASQERICNVLYGIM